MSIRKKRKSKLDPFLDKVGIVPDKVIGELAGVTPENVRAHRNRRGIPARWRGEGTPLPNEEAVRAEFGLEEPTAKKPRKSKPTKKEPAKKRKQRKSKLDPYLDQLGQVPDREVAELAGVTPENVRAYRKRRGIPARWRDSGGGGQVAPAKPASRKSGKRKPRRGKLTPFLDQVGVLPDARIAEMAGTSLGNVRAFRIRHGIPARWKGEGVEVEVAEAAEVETVAAVASSPEPTVVHEETVSQLEGYEVTVDGAEGEEKYVVVGRDIAEAARTAIEGVARRGGGKVVGVRFLAGVLTG